MNITHTPAHARNRLYYTQCIYRLNYCCCLQKNVYCYPTEPSIENRRFTHRIAIGTKWIGVCNLLGWMWNGRLKLYQFHLSPELCKHGNIASFFFHTKRNKVHVFFVLRFWPTVNMGHLDESQILLCLNFFSFKNEKNSRQELLIKYQPKKSFRKTPYFSCLFGLVEFKTRTTKKKRVVLKIKSPSTFKCIATDQLKKWNEALIWKRCVFWEREKKLGIVKRHQIRGLFTDYRQTAPPPSFWTKNNVVR